MPTMEDRLLRKQKTRFAARGSEIAAFRNLFSGSDIEYNILNYVGFGGIGKTTQRRNPGMVMRESASIVLSQ